MIFCETFRYVHWLLVVLVQLCILTVDVDQATTTTTSDYHGTLGAEEYDKSQDVIITVQIGENKEVLSHRYNSTKLVYDGCLSLKSCHAPIDKSKHTATEHVDCILSLDCEMVWALGKQPIHPREHDIVRPQDDEIVLEIYAATSVWVAVGISVDQQMGEDFVLECVKENDTVNLYTSWNVVNTLYSQRLHGNRRLTMPDNVTKLVLSRFDDNSLYCRINLKNKFIVPNPYTLNTYSFDFKKHVYCVLAAYGDQLLIKEGKVVGVGSHETGKRAGKGICAEFIDLTQHRTPSPTQVIKLQGHGYHNVVAFLGFFSTSIFVARYYQTTLGSASGYKSYQGVELWVWIHGILAAYPALTGISDFIGVEITVQNWQGSLTFPFHKYGGMLTIVLNICNLITGFYIRKTDEASIKSPAIYVIHGVGGHCAFVLGTFVVLLSFHLEYAFIPCVTSDWIASFLVLYFITHCIMSTNNYWLNRLHRVGNLNSAMITPSLLVTQKTTNTAWFIEYPETRKTRLYILAFYIIFTWSFTIGISTLIATSHESCSLENTWRPLEDQEEK